MPFRAKPQDVRWNVKRTAAPIPCRQEAEGIEKSGPRREWSSRYSYTHGQVVIGEIGQRRGEVRTGEERLDQAVLGVEPTVRIAHVGRLGLALRFRRERETQCCCDDRHHVSSANECE